LLTSRPVAPADALPTGSRIASFEIEAVIARGPRTFVYLAQDLTRGMPVAIKEFAAARRFGAAPHRPNEPIDPLVQRGLQAFMAEARMLAACHHPSLVRVEALLDANGTAYRVMPFYKGLSLVHVRTGLGRAPDDATLRAWGSDLVGALQAMHDTGHAHGGVSPENIMLLADDRPLLFGAGSASHRVGSDLVESLLANFGLGGPAAASGEPDPQLLSAAAAGAVLDHPPAASAAPVEAVADDMRALAAVLRFCISGEPVSGTSAFEIASPPAPQTAPAAPAASASPLAPLSVATPHEALAQPALPTRLFAQHVQTPTATAAPHTEFTAELGSDSEPASKPWSSAPASAMVPGLSPRPLIPERWHIPMWVGLIALTGVAVLAVMSYVMGAWNRMPPIDFDRSLQTAPVLTSPATSPAVPAAAPRPGPGLGLGSTPTAAPPRRNRAEPDRNTTPPTAPASAASDAVPPTAALLTNPRDAPAAGLPLAAKAAAVTAPSTKPPQRVVKNAPRKAPPKRRAPPVAAAKVTTPLAACGARTNFALERCMQIQCQNKEWAQHPQCTSRRAT
jgi:serine/threonine protein kinase